VITCSGVAEVAVRVMHIQLKVTYVKTYSTNMSGGDSYYMMSWKCIIVTYVVLEFMDLLFRNLELHTHLDGAHRYFVQFRTICVRSLD